MPVPEGGWETPLALLAPGDTATTGAGGDGEESAGAAVSPAGPGDELTASALERLTNSRQTEGKR